MSFLRNQVEKLRKLYHEPGSRFHRFWPAFDALETFLFAPAHGTPRHGPHVRDYIDLKRAMNMVIIAMLPCLLWAIYNTGQQHFLAWAGLVEAGKAANDAYVAGWLQSIVAPDLAAPGLFEYVVFGLQRMLPILIVSYGVGLGIEMIFSIVRKEEVSEGYLVSGMLIALIVPASIPLWQLAIGVAFAVVLGKEVFGDDHRLHRQRSRQSGQNGERVHIHDAETDKSMVGNDGLVRRRPHHVSGSHCAQIAADGEPAVVVAHRRLRRRRSRDQGDEKDAEATHAGDSGFRHRIVSLDGRIGRGIPPVQRRQRQRYQNVAAKSRKAVIGATFEFGDHVLEREAGEMRMASGMRADRKTFGDKTAQRLPIERRQGRDAERRSAPVVRGADATGDEKPRRR